MCVWSLHRLSCSAVGVMAAALILSSIASPAFSEERSERDNRQQPGGFNQQSGDNDRQRSGDDERWQLTSSCKYDSRDRDHDSRKHDDDCSKDVSKR